LEGRPESEWQSLQAHLNGVAERAARFADSFGAGEWGRLAGLWHDLGKFRPEFQARLRGEPVAVEHSGLGAALAAAKDLECGLPLAFAVAGHHGGLPNLRRSDAGLPTSLIDRLRSNQAPLESLRESVPGHVLAAELPPLPQSLHVPPEADRCALADARRRMEFWIRFLYSALVDADWLDTEAFLQPERTVLRGRFDDLETLAARLDGAIEQLITGIPIEIRSSPVNRARKEVLTACRDAAREPPGLFALTVPTGGGKTFSAMTFALRHAIRHGLRRVVVVIPYTSIIEQNAQKYREALGAGNVIEHHSNLDLPRMREELGEEPAGRHELASENWDAPVIVTTTVQFFESLFGNRPSRCRKVHNVARSVIVLDEVQTLPPRFLLSMVEALRELAAGYGCSVVLSTATPPALERREGFDIGLEDVREIIPRGCALNAALKRVDFHWPGDDAPAVTWEALTSELASHEQVLAVVHRRADARMLAQLLASAGGSETVRHLSALMCPAHRSAVLADIDRALSEGAPCRVVSTQLVEAGVDLDFPVVYRAMAGLDSIVQAAGRCNREGTAVRGKVIVFRAPSPPPDGTPRKAMEVTEALLREADGRLDPDDPSIFERYFRMLYMKEDKDTCGIQTERQELNFATVGRDFRLIEDGFTRGVVVPYGDAPRWLQALRSEGPTRDTFRALQRYIVNIYPGAFERLCVTGALEQIVEGVFCLTPGFSHLYDNRYGLITDDTPNADPAELVV
jgi:CRISPR-associated endonuclease/helicase Cas3